MKLIGIMLLIAGLFALAGGLAGAVALHVVPNKECDQAAYDKAEADRLHRQADASGDASERGRLREQAFDKSNDAEVSASICREREEITKIATAAGSVVAGAGLLVTIAGFVMFRRGRRAGV